MLQIIQYQKTGEIFVEELPIPQLREEGVLVRNKYSLISAGTERTSVETAKATLIGKAKKRPDLVKHVINNFRREGLVSTIKKVKTRLDVYKALGYSSAGIVIESACDEFQVGDRVSCAGVGYASHAEVVFIPKNLVSKMPDSVNFDEAAFTTLGAIAMQGVRQADVRIGENVAIIGLGLLGQLTLQIVKAAGCSVIGLDISESVLELAKELGADEVVKSDVFRAERAVNALTGGVGVDTVIITAATHSNEPIEISGNICRDRGKVVIVGAVKADIPRSPFYEKEIEIKMSRSYGPGRYDSGYEEKGNDYPIGYVRWTENRNMDSFLKLISDGKIDVKKLITHRFSIEEGIKAYDVILGKTKERYIGVLIEYPEGTKSKKIEETRISIKGKKTRLKKGKVSIGFVGAGNFAQSYLLPQLQKLNVNLIGVTTSTSVNAKSVAKKFGFEFCATDPGEILENNDIDVVFIATRHDSHAQYVKEALLREKAVYVEKPLCINKHQLEDIVEVYCNGIAKSPFLMVGYNRRFSEPIKLIREIFHARNEPLMIHYRVNAGPLPEGHWLLDPAQGGRVIGEAGHFIDVMQFITGAQPVTVTAECLDGNSKNLINRDNVALTLKFDDGSIGTLNYICTGSLSFPKEYIEVFGDGKVAVMDNFRRVRLNIERKTKVYRFSGDKGHLNEMRAVVEALNSRKGSPISFESLYRTSRVTFAAMLAIETGKVQDLRRK